MIAAVICWSARNVFLIGLALTLVVIPAIYAVVKGLAIRSPSAAPAFQRP